MKHGCVTVAITIIDSSLCELLNVIHRLGFVGKAFMFFLTCIIGLIY